MKTSVLDLFKTWVDINELRKRLQRLATRSVFLGKTPAFSAKQLCDEEKATVITFSLASKHSTWSDQAVSPLSIAINASQRCI